jgi:hypothetical protein
VSDESKIFDRCWLCTKIVPKATNPPDIATEDLCDCLETPKESFEERLEEFEQRIERLEER